MDKAESKFTNMARRMDAAMLQLLEEKPFNAITVTDVCKAADAHRSTFYSHYGNTLDLLNEVKDQTMRDFYASFEHLPHDATFADREYLDAYLEFVEEHRRLFRVFLENIKLFDGFGILMNFEDDIRNMPSIVYRKLAKGASVKIQAAVHGIWHHEHRVILAGIGVQGVSRAAEGPYLGVRKRQIAPNQNRSSVKPPPPADPRNTPHSATLAPCQCAAIAKAPLRF